MVDAHSKADFAAEFPILKRTINGRPLVYLDNAATSQKPRCVLDAQRAFYEKHNANVHRGVHTLSAEATEAYEDARRTVASFINAAPSEIVFVRNATEGINLVARSWAKQHVKKGDMILLTIAEHHSNIVPWQQVAAENGATIEYVPLAADGRLDLAAYACLLARKPRLVAFQHASNVLGTVNPAAAMVSQAHDAGALVLLDACQSVSHLPVDVKALGCDFLVFSGHKTFGPLGIGVLYARSGLLDAMPPFLTGGDMIREVTVKGSTWNDVPHKFEAGTPNVAGAVGLAEAIRYIDRIGLAVLSSHENDLTAYALRRLAGIPGLRILGPTTAVDRIGAISFTLEGVPSHDVASLLDDEGIAVRSGHHCAMPLHAASGLEGSVRASIAIFNTEQDIDTLVAGLHRCRKVFGL